MTRCLVTGIAGFIGSSIATGLVERGHEVRGLDNLSTGKLENLLPLTASIDFTRGDIGDQPLLHRMLKGVDTVFHLAAVASVQQSMDDPIGTYATNVLGTRHLIAAAVRAGVRRIVFASSSAIYGDPVRMPVSELDRPSPLSPYAAHKLECELMLEHAWQNGDLETVALRYFNVFGPRQSADSAYTSVIVNFIRAMQHSGRRGPVTIFGDGEQTRDFIYIADVVRASLAAMDASTSVAGGGAFNIGTGRRHTLLETARTIAQIVGYDEAFLLQAPRSGDVRHSVADVRLATSALAFSASTSFRDGLAATIADAAERTRLYDQQRARTLQMGFASPAAANASQNDERLAS